MYVGQTRDACEREGEIDAAELVADVNTKLAVLRTHLSDDDADALVIYAGGRIDRLKGRR